MSGYSFLLLLALVVSAPWWLWRMAHTGRYREGLRERLGFVPDALRAAVAGKRIVWVHAVSVGEVLAAERMIAELNTALGDGWVVAVSTTTATGNKIARERLRGSPVFYLPLDFAFAVRRYLRVLRPSLLVLMENEMWPRLLTECNRRGIPVAIANARVSDRSFNKSAWRHRLWRPMLRKVDLYLAQGAETAERLVAMGAPVERVLVTGNLKYDAPGGGDNAMVRLIGRTLWKPRLLVAGSTHEGEEKALLAAWPRLLKAVPDLALMIAPRHPQRFDAVWELVRGSGYPRFRCTQLLTITEPIFAGTILMLDTIGDLGAMYGIASAAFIGGSLIPHGGQNPLEAIRFGIPVVMGPSYENFREIVERTSGAGTLRIVRREEFADGLIEALKKTPDGHRHFEGQTGATKKTVDALLVLMGESK